MCKQSIAAKHVAVTDWNKANGTNAMERLLAHYEFVAIRWRGPEPLQVDVASIVHVVAEARMRFQPASVRQIDCARSNIIDRGAAIIVGRRDRMLRCLRSRNPFPGGASGRCKLRRGSAGNRLRCVLARTRRWQVCIVQYVAVAVLRLGDRDVPARKALVERSEVEEKTLAERSVAAR